MNGINEQLFRDRVRERDLDNFLIEELFSSMDFRTWFLKHAAASFTVPDTEDIRLEKSPQRLQDSRQTDVRMGWFDGSAELIACALIESKVTADFQPGQAEAYASELAAHRSSLGTRAACALLVAPQKKLATLVGSVLFDACVSVEEISEFLSERRHGADLPKELDARLATRVALLEAICGKRIGDGWIPLTIPEKRSFSEYYAALASEIVPNLSVRSSTDGPKALTKFFDGLFLPYNFPSVKLKHEFGSGVGWKYANLQFDGLESKLIALRMSGLLEGTEFAAVVSGESLFVRAITPAINPQRPFEREQENVIKGLLTIGQLAEWVTANAGALIEVLTNSAANKHAREVTTPSRQRIEQFRQVLLSIYRECEKFGYKPTGMLRMIDEHGPIGAAKQLVAKPPSDGFARLAIEGRLDLAIESVILKNEWSDLFTEEEKAIARRRLHSR